MANNENKSEALESNVKVCEVPSRPEDNPRGGGGEVGEATNNGMQKRKTNQIRSNDDKEENFGQNQKKTNLLWF